MSCNGKVQLADTTPFETIVFTEKINGCGIYKDKDERTWEVNGIYQNNVYAKPHGTFVYFDNNFYIAAYE